MGQVSVVDRGSKEIVVFLSGDIDRAMEDQLSDALRRVTLLERVNDLSRAVIDTREVTAFDDTGVRFVRRLEQIGHERAFDVALCMTSKPVSEALATA